MNEQLIHQKYRDILAELRAESASKQSVFRPSVNHNETEKIEDYIYFPKTPRKVGGLSLEGRYLLICFIIGTIIIGTMALCDMLLRPDTIAEVKPTSISVIPSVKSEEISLTQDVELIKKILTRLVQSVQVLSEERKQPDMQIRFPYPIKVTSEKANLRSSPRFAANSVSIVLKDTILLATNEDNGWLEVSTPKGEEAWISQDIVTTVGE